MSLDGIEWGDVPGWIESLATGGAFAVVAWTLLMQLRDRRGEQAAKVDFLVWAAPLSDDGSGYGFPQRATVGVAAVRWDQIMVTISNASSMAINDVFLYLPFPNARVVSLGKVPPGDHTLPFVSLDRPAQPEMIELARLVPMIQFMDSNARVWQRTVRGELAHKRRGHLRDEGHHVAR
ncbi:hypothetical protein [Winogradskya humida]|uniref:Uncharacterized protein n=1 Tax=Winogradskya humida TaxID=113566 RepID=A0ABQ4A264_9ACTN|nr:hypothetical protein [Actinoplanes humidus]GIE24947.1 hypothetical protein Ahu01nite_080490 [Actinoplanes humidus]